MNRLALAGGVAMLLAAGAVQAQPKAQYSADDVIKTFAQPAVAPKPADAPDDCVTKDDDGVCQPRKDARGFSLPTRATVRAAAGAPASMPVAHRTAPASAPTRVARFDSSERAVPVVHRDLLITFKTGSAELTDQAQTNARVFATAVNSPQLSSARFEIDGHTDAVGTADSNIALSQARAEAVKTFLVGQGVDSNRLVPHGFGFEHPAVPENPRAAANRRVEARRID